MAIQVSDVLRNFQPDYPVVSVKDGAVQGFWNGVDSTHQVGIVTSPTVIAGTTYQTERYLARTDTGQVVSFATTRGPYADNDAIIEKGGIITTVTDTSSTTRTRLFVPITTYTGAQNATANTRGSRSKFSEIVQQFDTYDRIAVSTVRNLAQSGDEVSVGVFSAALNRMYRVDFWDAITYITDSAGYITEVAEDTTPALGGDLDTGNNVLYSADYVRVSPVLKLEPQSAEPEVVPGGIYADTGNNLYFGTS